jgi:serine protease Do
MKRLHTTMRQAVWLTAALAGLVFAPASADEPRTLGDDDASVSSEASDLEESLGLDRLFVPRWRLTDGPQVRSAFRDVVKEAAKATVSIQCDGKQLALGGVIRSDGWIITKATPLCGKLKVVAPDGRKFEATTVGENGKYDLALLKVDAKNLPALDMSAKDAPEVGSWLASVGMSRDPVAVGVVSVAAREIPPQAGVLGVVLDTELPLVVAVAEESPAEQAGVKAQDRIVQVAGKSTPTRAKLKEVVASFNPGDDVEFVVERGGKRMSLKATLGGDFPGFMGRHDFQNSLGGKLSVRRFGFPLAFQHDTVLKPSDCGGPVVDIDGHVVGFNIARSGRTESYALPNSAVQEVATELIAEKLMVGKEVPAGDSEAAKPTASVKPALVN